ncbi:hypothetical protein [Vibrio sp. SCSIO 43169]|uniref:DUF7684 family protein n=1 Tax=Vibrio sp. SCSIO 43169 TaxID=2822801 RepID=UPI00204472FD|nr:hypothetical protein [Vibrio sp. SCSIO 43169]MCM5511644.1 hypothetical protein [Vibrio sp. SCSIO 43169]
MGNKKVVLVAKSKYSPDSDDFLLKILTDGARLICIAGADCSTWEDAIDELAVGDGSQVFDVTTTSHPNESELEVMEFARSFPLVGNSVVQIVRI